MTGIHEMMAAAEGAAWRFEKTGDRWAIPCGARVPFSIMGKEVLGQIVVNGEGVVELRVEPLRSCGDDATWMLSLEGTEWEASLYNGKGFLTDMEELMDRAIDKAVSIRNVWAGHEALEEN